MRDSAEQLLKIAKDKAYSIIKGNNPGKSCLDILSLNSDGQWAARIEQKLRKDLEIYEGDAKAMRTMRPFTVDGARNMLNWLEQAKSIPSSTIYTISEASMKLGISEGDLGFRYLLSKQEAETQKGDSKKDGALAALVNAISKSHGSNVYMYMEAGDHIDKKRMRSPWRDLAELKNQKTG
jgi:hypothetical protein